MQINKKLKESEMRYRRLFETAQDGILILDFKSGKIVDANPFVVEIIDYPLEQVVGKKLWEIGLFSNKEQSERAFIKLKTNGYIRFDNMPLKKKDGKKIEVEFISNVYLVNRKKVIQCNIRDITERKQAEKRQELAITILSILKTRNKWKQLIKDVLVVVKDYTEMEAIGVRLKEGEDFPYFEAIGFPKSFVEERKYLCTRNEKGEIIYDNKGNPYLGCIYGDVIYGRTDSSLPYFTEGGSFYSNNVSELITTAAEKEKQSATLKQCNKEGYESVALIPLYSGKETIGLLQLNDKCPDMVSLEMIRFLEKIGSSIGIALNRIQNEEKIKEGGQNLLQRNTEYNNLSTDYSDLTKELTESLNHVLNINDELINAKAKAEESDNLKSAFLANISHEIRTPMNAIMGFSEFLLQPRLSKAKIKDFVQIINSSSHQLLSIINDIIDSSKIETGQLTINYELVNINNLLNELFIMYKKLAELKNLSLHNSYERPNDLIQVYTDGNRIKQIFCNLLNNAIKFTKEGKIEIGYRIKGNFIELYVKDTGIGIAEENQALIFQRFKQVKQTGDVIYGGTGLGLSISKALIEKMGGTITVNSKPGIGSAFIFAIPFIRKTEDNNSLIEDKSGKHINWNKKIILLVEDEINNHAYFEELLSDTNVKVLHAWDGKEAIEQIKKYSDISLVLIDIKMPILDGYKATQIIKQIRPKLPVIAQTAYALSNDREQALKAGCDNYFAKPIDKGVFIEVLNSYLS